MILSARSVKRSVRFARLRRDFSLFVLAEIAEWVNVRLDVINSKT
jgi:hypothetical protein